MPRVRTLLAAALLCCATACGSDPSPATAVYFGDAVASPSGGPQFFVIYENARTEELRQARALMQRNKILEWAAQIGNEMINLPRSIPVIARECGEDNAY